MHQSSFDSIDNWLNDIKSLCSLNSPDLLPLLKIHSNEAKFFYKHISNDLSALKPSAKILEIGAGSLLLSCYLQSQGYKVYALEPNASGFTHFDKLHKIVLSRATTLGISPHVIITPVENLKIKNNFDYAFSINVMEHVKNVKLAIFNVAESLTQIGVYRFTCPNYLFPYEPHFNIPTLFSKKLTGLVFKKKIFESKNMPDPYGTWASLNWINPLKILIIALQSSSIDVKWNRDFTEKIIERIANDNHFASRHPSLIKAIIIKTIELNFHKLFKYIPLIFHPIIDCNISNHK